MEQEHLHRLITEEIYMLPEDHLEENMVSKSPEKKAEDNNTEVGVAQSKTEVETEVVNESDVKFEAKEEVVSSAPNIDKATETPAHIETKQESPEIPVHDLEPSKEIPFAVFHSSNDASDIDLLHKIIDACKVPQDQYKIFGGGFDQSIHFKKALVFVPEAKAFYTPIPYKNSEFLCSKPLHHISGDNQEKAKLWGALQKFVL